ncbi:polyhomeotic-proximal chromatin protein [Drosophila sechellia]|uniref:polyhomeotic-proximal chromatin protein n=1 Tax=Drosophila sechellia TaxID=7238 RepID=UPI0013DE5FF1|nr:polyhomeotic-proximal chromatin protein [Drosophila sechellia]
MDVQQQLQLQQQLSEASSGGTASAGAGGAASPANSQQSQQQQHSTAISTMSPMQLAAATGGVGGDWTQGRTVQLMQPSTSFLYPQMIVSGNLLHPGGLGQQPIQVITAGKPFQGNGPQMLTTTTQNAKQMIGGQAGFAGGNYATCIPSNHNQSPQTVLISPVNVISHSPQQQQNLLQSMAAAAQQQQLTQQQQQQLNQQQQQLNQHQQQQQLTAALAKVGVDAQGKLAQKVVQKVTTTSSTVQAATGPGSTGSTQTQQVQQVQQQQQQTTQTTQQCVQVSQSTLPVGVGGQSVQTAQLLNAGQAQQMQIPWFWQNATAGLQPFGSNQIILRNQPDGTQGMFIQQQPATQTLQTQQNQIIQCNVTQTPTKARTQLDALAPKQQQQQVGTTNQTQQQQLAVATAQLQQQQQQLTAAALQRPGAPIMPHNGTQVRPASSVSTQTAQNQSLLKAKMRNKQQPVRPALATLKTEIGQVAGQNKVVGHLTTVQQQQQATNLQQVVNAAGNKMVVMSTTGTPITLQNGQTLHAATAAGVDKQQQQLQLIQKQQILQQQMFAAIQMQQQQAAVQAQQQQQQQVSQQQQVNAQQQQAVAQQQQAVAQAQQQQREQQQQVAQAQAQHQQALANATQQILQVAPNQFITSHQQQQQQQLHNQLIQQQLQQQAQAQVQAQVQAQAQQQQQQREQQQNIIQQIVVQQSAGATSQQQQQPQQQSGQLQLSSVPFSVSSSMTAEDIAGITSSALQEALSASGAIFQTTKPITCSSSTLPTSSVVTITSQSSTPLVTSSTVASMQQAQAQGTQIHQHPQLISATIAGGSQQQQQQLGLPSLTPTTPSPTTNPILAMTSMMNATVGHLSTAPPVSVSSTAVTPSSGQLVTLSSGSSGGGAGFPATPTKEAPSKGPTATLVPIGSPKTPVSAKDTCTTPKSSTPATFSASVEASSSTGEALSNGDASDRSSTPSKGATTPTSKQSNAVQPPSSTTPSSVSGKEEPKLATSGSLTSATSTSTTTTITNGIGVARTTASTTAVSTASTTTTSSGTFTTSCTSTTTTTTSGISNGSKDLPKAMIKPNVLTHVIDGFIIQEANEPFPVTRQRYADKDVSDEPPKKKATMQEDIKLSGIASAPGSDMVACEQCGKMEHKAKLKRKRYCSPGCSRQAKNGIGGVGSGESNGLGTGGIVGVDAMALVDRLDEAMAEEKMQTESFQTVSEALPIQAATPEVPPISMPVLAAMSTSSPLSLPLTLPLPIAIAPTVSLPVVSAGMVAPVLAIPSSNVNGSDRPPISSWSVEEVSNFIRELPGCQDYVDDFIQQEIDGQALLLLKENHLVNAMGMKLGPALKIVAKVESIKEVPPGDVKD